MISELVVDPISVPCNCMMDDSHMERTDEGNLTEKSYLPIRTLLYGDTGLPGEYIDSTLGPVKCFFNLGAWTSIHRPCFEHQYLDQLYHKCNFG